MKLFKRFDLIIQGLLIANVGIPLLLIPLDNGFAFWSMVFLFFLGVWQLFSALLLGFGLPDKFRRLYLLTAVSFCGLPFVVGYIREQFFDQFHGHLFYKAEETIFIVVLIISFIAALYYFSYSYRDYMTDRNSQNNSTL